MASRRAIRSQDVNDYIREATGVDFSSKHFRTWGGTIHAADAVCAGAAAGQQGDAASVMNRLIDQVAHRLGNTRAVCRKCYIHPRVMETWEAGTLAEEMLAARRSFRKPLSGLDEEETLILKWLSR